MAEIKCLLITLLFYSFNIVESSDVICEPGFCRNFLLEVGCTSTAEDCSINNATHTGMWLPSPTLCNCCSYCLPFYGDAEHCSTGGPGLGTTIGRCGAGLTCVPDVSDGHNYCQRLQSNCHNAQDAFDARELRGETGGLEHRPHCDGKGKYAAFDCVPAQTCFCQSEEGERLFGEVIYMGKVTTQNIHCTCSRLHDKIKKSISPGVRLPVVGPRCTIDGNFNPVQCINRTCHCVDRITGVILEGQGMMIDLDKKPISDLSCYDAALDLFPQNTGEPPFNYTTPCLENTKRWIDVILQGEKDGYNVEYFSTIPDCLPDATYERVANTRNGTKICINERGGRIGDYEGEPNTPEYTTMDCKCAQTSLVMAGSSEKPVCCKNGNFRRIQCRRGKCRCVDSDGRQTEPESADVSKLSCYRHDWRTC